MAGLDLSGIAKLVEGLVMLDTVRITEPGPGTPVFDQASGEYTYPEGAVVYEGIGAVLAQNLNDMTSVPVVGQPWTDETRSRYRLLTPLDAPIPGRDHLVSVVQVHAGGDLSLIGRHWRCLDPGRASTLNAVRTTPIDQVQVHGEE
ncbi:DUF6093 family protein [Streptomyces sp. AS02]|uniref:DUF6093 family protein n=1 Tax=Streptomyces sp. AS02 TaxID=2938946 RepID=UPI002021F8AD|nr:DUF6093 family protein [Streptomyces sp. AS02]MCL8016973.1 DUF6093 family protein [Streptomyces sp. AS02]